MGCATSYPTNFFPLITKKNNHSSVYIGKDGKDGRDTTYQQKKYTPNNYPVCPKIFPTCLTISRYIYSPQGYNRRYKGYPNNFQILINKILSGGYNNSVKIPQLEFNEDKKFANEFRLSLNRKQIFSLNKSWKKISRNIDTIGVIMFVK
ncbi:unnamed protein product [Gordionus sp. m RMFG-2023]